MGSGKLWFFITILAAAGWFLTDYYEVRGWRELKLARRDTDDARGSPAAPRNTDTIRIAAFHLTSLSPLQLDKPEWTEIVAGTIGRFDVVALQGLQCERADMLQRLLDRVNATGRSYALLAGPPVGRSATSREQFAFVFDQATVEVDRAASYTVDDPDDLLCRPPLVGWFRTRSPALDQAFTFTLAAIHLDVDHVDEELNVLDHVFFSIRDDGRDEDDVILLGTFRVDDRQLSQRTRVPGLLAAITALPTNTRQTRQESNLVFQLPSTSEYTGRSGVVDFLREYNLTVDQAIQISEFLPVWAEFSVREGNATATAAEPTRARR